MSEPAGPKGPEFLAAGEIRSSIGKSAAWDDWNIRGPRVNLTRSADGSWDGTAGPAMTGLPPRGEAGRARAGPASA